MQLLILSLGLALLAPPATTANENGNKDANSYASLLAATRAADTDAVRQLLQRGADVHETYGDGMTSLHWAAQAGLDEVGDMLIYAGANVHARTRIGGHTPLMLAARRGSGELVTRLLEAGSNPGASTRTGATALMFAAASGDTLSVEALLEHGASVYDVEKRHGQTALMFAAEAGRTEAVRLLIEHGAETCATTATVDSAAQERELFSAYAARAKAAREKEAAAKKAAGESAPAAGRNEAAANELQSVDRPGADGKKGRKKKQKSAERRGPRPRSFGQLVGRRGGMTALHYAARQGHAETVLALIEGGADIDQTTDGDRSSPLLVATVNGNFDVAKTLLDRGADPNLASAAGVAPLYAAVNVQWAPHSFYPQPSPAKARTSHLELMQALIDRGADVDARLETKVWYTGFNFDQSGVDESGASAFWRAAQSSDLEAMRLLVDAGADPTLGSVVVPERRLPNGRNAGKDLEKAVPKLGSPAVSALQVASGAGWVGNFHRNAPGGMMPVVRYLVEEHGFDVNDADSKGYTPMHNAAARGDDEMILYLVFHGARVDSVARSGETIADMANGPVQRIQPFPETLALLEGMGSKNNDNCVSC
ncbi:MAG: ankyrin repeat domain-containing protein [Acidobacteriota bacterium]